MTTGGSEKYEDVVGDIVVLAGDGNFETSAGGSDIWNSADGGQFWYHNVEGDFILEATVQNDVNNVHVWHKCALMAREELTDGSRHFMVAARRGENLVPDAGETVWTSTGMVMGQMRQETDSRSHSTTNDYRYSRGDSAGAARTYEPTRVRLERKGDEQYFWYLAEDETWVRVINPVTHQGTPPTVSGFPETMHVGLAMTSHERGVIGRCKYTEVRWVKGKPLEGVSPLPVASPPPIASR
jgi:hypothetical protein